MILHFGQIIASGRVEKVADGQTFVVSLFLPKAQVMCWNVPAMSPLLEAKPRVMRLGEKLVASEIVLTLRRSCELSILISSHVLRLCTRMRFRKQHNS